jgi:hypothetical protein
MNTYSAEPQQTSNQVGTLNEKPLHAALKEWYAQPDDCFEEPVDGFIIDIVRDELLIEVQTGNFSAIKQKLTELVAHHPVRLAYPIAREKWIVKVADDQQTQLSRRKSPKRCGWHEIFEELVSFPRLLAEANFSLEVLLIQEEEVRRYDGRRGWRRRGWVTHERRLLQVVDRRRFETPAEMADLMPQALAEPFSTADLAAAISKPRRLAQKMAYCLREMGVIEPVGKQGNAFLYARTRCH